MSSASLSTATVFGLEFTPECVREVGPEALRERIPVERIRQCELRYGSLSKRPRLQLMIGLVMSSGLYFVVRFGIVLVSGSGSFPGRVALAMMFTGVIGSWMIWDALQRQFYLHVATDTDHYHLRVLAPAGQRWIESLRNAARDGSNLEVAGPVRIRLLSLAPVRREAGS